MVPPWGAGHLPRPGFNLLPSFSAQVLICDVRWHGKLLGALERVVLRLAPETMVFISSPQLRMTFEWWHIYAPGSPHTSVARYGRRVQEA